MSYNVIQQSMSRKGLAQYTAHRTIPYKKDALQVSRLSKLLNWYISQLMKRNYMLVYIYSDTKIRYDLINSIMVSVIVKLKINLNLCPIFVDH